MGIKQQDSDTTKTTAMLIHEQFPDFTPAMLRGGVSCINTTDIVNHLPEYLEAVGNVNFWAIEMGTNDGWGGGTWNLSTYVQNLQTIIDAAKAYGISVVLARTLATDSSKAGWQLAPEFLAAEDSLIQVNGLYQGPDFYAFFKEHPEYLASDGVHPNGETGRRRCNAPFVGRSNRPDLCGHDFGNLFPSKKGFVGIAFACESHCEWWKCRNSHPQGKLGAKL